MYVCVLECMYVHACTCTSVIPEELHTARATHLWRMGARLSRMAAVD